MADVAGEGAGHPGHRLRVRLADRSLAATNPLLGPRRAARRAGPGPDDGQPGARRRRRRPGAGPVRPRRRGPGADHPLGRRERRSAGATTPTSAPPSASPAWAPTPGRPGCAGCCSGRPCPGSTTAGWPARVPVDDVSDGDLDLVGRFAELVDRVHTFVARAERAATVTDWTAALTEAVHGLTSTAPEEVWQVAQFDREVARIAAGAGDPAPRCGRPTYAPCSSSGCADAPPGPTSAPAPSPSARWCRCARCRTGSCAWSGLDDGVFPRVSTVDGDDVLARRPTHRRARPARRGPPAAPRRDRRGHRDARHHLRRARRAHQRRAARRPCRSASCSTRSTGPPRRRCATTCSSTTRSSPSTRTTCRRGAARGRRLLLRPPRRSPAPRRARRAPPGRRAGAEPAAARRARRTSRWPTCTTSSPTRCAASCGGCGSRAPTTSTRSRTPSRSPSTASRSGRSATTSPRKCSAAPTPSPSARRSR